MWEGNVSIQADGDSLNIEVANDNAKGETLCTMSLRDLETGETIRKTVSLDDCIAILKGGERKVKHLTYLPYKKGFFPDTIREAWLADEENYICTFTIPASRQTVYYSPDGKKAQIFPDCPMPELLFYLEAFGGNFREKLVFALKPEAGKKKESRRLYQFPLGNVSNGGSICMGNISSDARKGVQGFVSDFFSGIRNDDYWTNGNHIKDPKLSQGDFLSLISKKEDFPYRLLLPSLGSNGLQKVEDVDSYAVKKADKEPRF